MWSRDTRYNSGFVLGSLTCRYTLNDSPHTHFDSSPQKCTSLQNWPLMNTPDSQDVHYTPPFATLVRMTMRMYGRAVETKQLLYASYTTAYYWPDFLLPSLSRQSIRTYTHSRCTKLDEHPGASNATLVAGRAHQTQRNVQTGTHTPCGYSSQMLCLLRPDV